MFYSKEYENEEDLNEENINMIKGYNFKGGAIVSLGKHIVNHLHAIHS